MSYDIKNMLGIELKIDEEEIYQGAVQGNHSSTAIIISKRIRDEQADVNLYFGGLISEERKNYIWADRMMTVGQKLEINFKDVIENSKAIRVSEFDQKQSNDERLKAYFELKQELEAKKLI
jgi:hypothetical protein